MVIKITSSILCVPNLQGEQNKIENTGHHLDWIAAAASLEKQVNIIRQDYSDHSFLLGSSFGGIAVWKFILEQRPKKLRGLILLDVLPSRAHFPFHKRMGIRVLRRMPSKISQGLYNAYRHLQGRDTVNNLNDIIKRLQSIYLHFPAEPPPLPTLILSRNPKFHRQWRRLAETHPFLTAELTANTSQQIADWIQSIRTTP